MGSKVTVKDNNLAKKMIKASKKARKAVAEQILTDSNPFVPKQEGILRNTPANHIEEKDDATYVVWDTPYAAYQYYGCWPDGSHQIKNHTPAGTTTKWVEKAKQKNKKKWNEVYQQAAKLL